MPIARMVPRAVEKPWGRRELPAPFEAWETGEPIGELIFDPPDRDAELLIKFLFTDQKLSIQVHPDDRAALAAGARRGKDEAWVVLASEPGAPIGFGLRRVLSVPELRAAVEEGSIERLIDWRPMAAGDCLYSPAGTIHAIGPGLSLLEIQQNCDVTYRLYDYGRARELHFEEVAAVAILGPAESSGGPAELEAGRTWLTGGPAFQVERLRGPIRGRLATGEADCLLLLLRGTGDLEGEALRLGEAWQMLGESRDIRLDADSELILAYPGSSITALWQRA